MRISTSVDEVIERIGYTKQSPENGGAMERREVRSDIRFRDEDVDQRWERRRSANHGYNGGRTENSTSVDEVIERIGYTKQSPENGGDATGGEVAYSYYWRSRKQGTHFERTELMIPD